MGVLPLTKQRTRIPIGQLQCKLKIPLYRKNGETFEPVKEGLKIGDTCLLYSLDNDIGEIQGGFYIKEVDQTHFSISLGELVVTGDNVQTCSKNGVLLRKLKKGSIFKVVSVIPISEDVSVYAINEKEYISSEEEIQFQIGSFIPSEEIIENHSVKYRKGEALPFQRVSNNRILLLDRSWLNIEMVKGQIVV